MAETVRSARAERSAVARSGAGIAAVAAALGGPVADGAGSSPTLGGPAPVRASRRKVAIVGPTPPPYHGNSVWTRQLLRSPELAAHYDVVHLETADRRTLANMGRLDARNVSLALRHAAGLARLLRRERPDVVYIQLSQNTLAYLRDAVLVAVARAHGCAVAVHLHGSDFRRFYIESGSAWRWLVRRSARSFAAAAVLGEGLKPLFGGLVPDERVHVAPVGIPDPFPDGPPARVRAADAPLQVTYLGMLYRPKGLLELLQAAAALRDERPALHFVLAGPWYSAADRAAAADLVRRLGLERSVSSPGVVDGEAKLRLWQQTDMFVFPGWQPEGTPLVILEAMAAGAAVVATNVGAVSDVLGGEAGVVVPPGDVGALTAAIRSLSVDAAERSRLAEAARARYLSRYTIGRAAGALVSFLDHALAVGAAAALPEAGP